MNLFANRFLNRILHKALWAALLPLCALWGVAQAVADHHRVDMPSNLRAATELPSEWQGQPLRPVALSEVELRFGRHFPGTVARMTTGQ